MKNFDFSDVKAGKEEFIVNLLTDLAKSVTDYPVSVEVEADVGEYFLINIALPGLPMTIDVHWYEDLNDAFGLVFCALIDWEQDGECPRVKTVKERYSEELIETEEDFREMIKFAIQEGEKLNDILDGRKFDFSGMSDDERAEYTVKRLAELAHEAVNLELFVDTDDGYEFDVIIEEGVPCGMTLEWVEFQNNKIKPMFEVKAASIVSENKTDTSSRVEDLIGETFRTEMAFEELVKEMVEEAKKINEF